MAQAPESQAPAAERNPILVAVVGVLEQGWDPSILRDVVERSRTELVSLWDEVEATAAGLAPSVQSASAPQVAAIAQAIAVYGNGLALIEQYLGDGQAITLSRGAEFVRRASIQLDQGLADLRNAALAAMGPSDMPDYNALHRVYARHVELGVDADDVMARAVERMSDQADTSISQAQELPASPERETLLTHYKNHLRACQVLLGHVKAGRLDLLERAMRDLEQALLAVRDAIPRIRMSLRTASPTRSPMVNYVIAMVGDLVRGNVTDQALRDALDQLDASFQVTRRQFEGIASSYSGSATMQEEAERVLEAFALEETAIQQLYTFFESRDGVLLGDSCRKLEDAMRQLDTSQASFMALAEREGKIPCMRCGVYNEGDHRRCSSCGGALIQSSESLPSSTFQFVEHPDAARVATDAPVGENVGILLVAVNRVAEGAISPEEFEREITRFEGTLEAHANPPRNYPLVQVESLPADQRARYEQALDACVRADDEFREGLDQLRLGLQLYRAFLADPQTIHLEEGTRHIWEGNGKMHEVQQISRTVRELLPT